MAAISSAELLEALDAAPSEIGQVMALLELAGHEPNEVPLAAGDRVLVALAESLTQSPIELTAQCAGCGEISMIEFGRVTIADHQPRTRWLGVGRGVRAPSYGDLCDLPDDPTDAVDELAARCSIGEVDRDSAVDAIDDVDGSLAGPVEVACYQCSAPLLIEADLQHLALRRLRGFAEEVDREVHLLAATYGWDLAAIQGLPDARRRRFAELIEAG